MTDTTLTGTAFHRASTLLLSALKHGALGETDVALQKRRERIVALEEALRDNPAAASWLEEELRVSREYLQRLEAAEARRVRDRDAERASRREPRWARREKRR